MKFTNNNGTIKFYTLFFEIDFEANALMDEDINHDHDQTLKNSKRTFWQRKELGENSRKRDTEDDKSIETH
jgi:hypothetical protein